MQICPRCGKTMDDNAPSCPSCHAPNAFQNPDEFNQYIHERRKRKKDDAFRKEQERLRILYEKQEQERRQKEENQKQLMEYYKAQTDKEERARRSKKRIMKAVTVAACVCLLVLGAVGVGLTMNNSSEDDTETVSDNNQPATSSVAQVTSQPDTAEETAASEAAPVEVTAEPVAPEPTAEPTPELQAAPEVTAAPTPAPASATSENGVYKQTVMMYIIGSNLESENGAAAADMKEIQKSGMDSDVVNCILYTGGCNNWTNNISSHKNSFYRIVKGKRKLLKTEKQKNMTKPSTLTGFINYCYENFKADKYTLILWDHGGGAIHGYGDDENYKGDGMSLQSLKKALGNSTLCQRDKIETVAFDACLMGSAEIAAGLKKYARYFVASEESIAGPGYDYSFMKEFSQPQMDGSKVGSSIVDYFYKYYDDLLILDESTLSCIDLSKMDRVESALNQLSARATKGLSSSYKKLKNSRRNLDEYGDESSFSYDLVDTSRMAKGMAKLYPAEAQALQDAIADAVISCKTTGENACGLTLYYPYSEPDYGPISLTIYSGFGFASKYEKYINKFFSKSFRTLRSGKREEEVPQTAMITKAAGNTQNVASVTLPEDLASRYEKARYYILKKDPEQEDSYLIAGAGEDVSLDGNILSTQAQSSIVKIADKTQNESYDTSIYLQKETETQKVYAADAELQRESIALGGHSETQTLDATVRVLQDKKTGECKPVDATINQESLTGMAPRVQIDLTKFTSIRYGATHYFPEKDSSGALKPVDKWTKSDQVTYHEYVPGNEYAVEQMDVPTDGSYEIVFEVTDQDGEVHMSEIQTIGTSGTNA